MDHAEETREFNINELKREYSDTDMVKHLYQYLADNQKSAMHLYITLAGVLGCTIADKSKDAEELQQMLELVLNLLCSATQITWNSKQKGDVDDGVSKLPN